MKDRILKYKGVFIFSVFKYIEIILTSLTTFLLAKKLGPFELGKAMPILLYITYANYLALGLNQVVTKNYSRISDEKKVPFISLNLQYILLISIVNIILSFVILDVNYALLAGLISILTILRGFFFSYYRSIDRIRILNYNNIVFSFLLLSIVYLFISELESYLITWCIGLFLACLHLFFRDIEFFKLVSKGLIRMPKKSDIIFNFSEGIKLALAGFVTTIFVTSDRFIVNSLNLETNIKGSYQLADYCGMAVYMISTTIVFYYYPKWINEIRNSPSFRQKYLKIIGLLYILYPFILFLFYGIGYFIIPLIFPEYNNLLSTSLTVVFAKLAVVSIGFISLYFIGLDKENEYLKVCLIPIILIIVFGLFVKLNNFNYTLLIPIVTGSILYVTSAFLIFYLKRFTEVF